MFQYYEVFVHNKQNLAMQLKVIAKSPILNKHSIGQVDIAMIVNVLKQKRKHYLVIY